MKRIGVFVIWYRSVFENYVKRKYNYILTITINLILQSWNISLNITIPNSLFTNFWLPTSVFPLFGTKLPYRSINNLNISDLSPTMISLQASTPLLSAADTSGSPLTTGLSLAGSYPWPFPPPHWPLPSLRLSANGLLGLPSPSHNPHLLASGISTGSNPVIHTSASAVTSSLPLASKEDSAAAINNNDDTIDKEKNSGMYSLLLP